MRYCMVTFVSLLMLAGCDDSVSTDIAALEEIMALEEITDIEETATTIEDTTASEEDTIDYSLINCGDDLSVVLTLINELRSEAQICATTTYPAVDSVTWNEKLYLAAQGHSDNMANYDFFDHTGLDGSTFGTRVSAQGYTWSYVSENIAAGQTSAQAAVDGWMSSEGHCINIMSANAREMGLACTVNNDASNKRYWTQVFAK